MALKAGFISAATAFSFFQVGQFTGHTPGFGTVDHIANIAGHAAVGCASSVASGGKCGPGALSAAAGSFAGPLLANAGLQRNVIARATVGGLASVAGGGKFGNGAVTAAFGYLFNELGGATTVPPGSGVGGTGIGEILGIAGRRLLGILGMVLSLSGDTVQYDYMVRLQAQGGGLESSVTISSHSPITVGDGHIGITQLATDIGPSDAILRREGFQQASHWITQVGVAGGVPSGVNRTFPHGTPQGAPRVDINILRGTNFIPGPRSGAIIAPTRFGVPR